MAEILRQHGTEYLKKYADKILPSHLKTIRHLTACRTPELGGQKWLCEKCGRIQYSYYSCRDRHCSKCQNDRIDQWLSEQLDLLLPVPYFMATITVPKPLRSICRIGPIASLFKDNQDTRPIIQAGHETENGTLSPT